jgi:hypothetical protein
MGTGAIAARQFADLTVEADAHAAASITEQARYDVMLDELDGIVKKEALRWRFVAGATGAELKTTHGCWGTDRRKNNVPGNAECVFSLDRRNITAMSYCKDLLAHYNYVYVAGQGEGSDRTVVERSTAADITAYKRRERLVEARQMSLAASLQAKGDGALAAMRPVEEMTVTPRVGTWKVLWDLGDYVTIYANRYGRTFSMDAEIMAVNVGIGKDGVERAVPELVKL